MIRRRVRPVLISTGLLVCGGLWWWAVLRLALVPGRSGALEGAVVAGGWGLSLLPVHVTSAGTSGRTPRYEGSISGRPFLRYARRWQERGIRNGGRPGIGLRVLRRYRGLRRGRTDR
ncbi:hypothetical protein [Streptomyces sp. NBC_00102]|uniref:hypothetical protein n=1 Tax=Streptomyces sp. NBC_00102 TaxID=2975652 RepID=UPI002259D39B|nr:hypothetical protein [Streptomyces sp. NBC_00102]MCX5400167.1 hypothetical protein [Streptomyces sp. NBC_00102]